MARNIAPQDVTWFLDLNDRQRLDLSPPYQRRSVWSPKERKFFLDTVFHGYPCPPLFLYKSISDKGVTTFHVVDGKQRLETIISFANNKISIPPDFDIASLAGKKFRQLDVEQKKIFWNYQFAVELLDVVEPATVKEIFGRYNRTAKNLEAQELRHAKYDGWFASFAENEAQKTEWSKLGVSTTARARRMKDIQFISELMIAILLNGEIIGFDQEKIDEFYANYEIPLEFDADFSEEEFIQNFERVKNKILEFENLNNAITTYAKSSTHFFTLWCVLCNNNLAHEDATAEKYTEFMARVNDIAQSETPLNFLNDENKDIYEKPFQYFENSRGANTEEPQRKKRNDILIEYLGS
jgi:hypothetical protein